MLTLEQVRAVNDGFKSGDLNAALRPLEETVDLRSNELPRLDKAATTALKTGLQNGEDAATWAQALFHPNISVRRFARKVFMGLGDEAEPLFAPLRVQLERYWAEEKPLEETNKPREAALRREQREMVEGALELLLRSHPENFLGFYADIIDATPVGNDNPNTKAIQEWQERNSKAWEATQKELNRLLEEEWGIEWVDSNKRWKLPSRVLRELNDRARAKPEVAELWEQLGESPYQRVAAEWQPAFMMTAGFGPYMFEAGLTGPQQRVSDRLRPVIREWVKKAFDFSSTPEDRARYALRLTGNRGWWGYGHWVGTHFLQTEMSGLLLEAKPRVIKPLEKLVSSENGLYGDERGEGDEVVARLWMTLMWAVATAFQRPYNVEPKDWQIPDEANAETLRELVAGLEPGKTLTYHFDRIKDAIKNIEETRKAQSSEAAEETETAKGAEEAPDAVIASSSLLTPYEVLSEEQLKEIYKDEGYTDAAQQRLQAAMKKVEQDMIDVEEPAKKIELLVEPPPHPRDPNKFISRMPYWKVWSNALGKGGEQKLKEAVWPDAAPKLWARLDAKLDEYRRTETDPVEPKIEQKLTERELKEWRAQTRRDKRQLIAREIWDITGLLFQVEGFEGRLKAIELADRPSCRDLRDQFEQHLISELERQPGHSSPEDSWQSWKLGEEWEVVLRKAEAQLEKAKEGWARSNLERQLATGYYRRGHFERFKDMALRPGVFPHAVSVAAAVLDDFEAWRVLVGASERWGAAHLTTYWTEQMKDPERKARAMEVALSTLATTGDEEIARRTLGWLATASPSDLEPFVSDLESALESSVVGVKKWAIGVLGKLPEADFDRERAAATAGEALWSENAGLAKEAAKFLALLGVQDAEVRETAWDALCDATALDNVGVAETVYRALAQMKTKNKELELSDAAREKLEALTEVNADRFAKFGKKLV